MSEETTTPTPGLTGFTCLQCGQQFSSGHGLRVHTIRKHGDPAKMAKWNKNIKRSQNIPAVRARIAKTKGYKPVDNGAALRCHLCSSPANSKATLLSHMYRSHGKAAAKAARLILRGKMVAPVKPIKVAIAKADREVIRAKNREYQRRFYEKKRAQQAPAPAPARQDQPQPQPQTTSAPACPNYCPNCGFGLAVVSVAMTIPNR